MNIKQLITSAAVLTAAATSLIAAPSITASLDPEEIPLNQASRLTIEIKGGERGVQPKLPNSPNLSFSPIGQSSQMSIINGQVSSSISYTYQVTASRKGTHQIDPITTKVGGRLMQTHPLTLKVLPPNKRSNPATHPQTGQLSEKEQKALNEVASLTINRADNNGREHLYVGESTPVMIRAYLRRGLRVRGLGKPKISSDAFTLSALSEEPEQDTTSIEGISYHTITWYGNLSGIKAGEYDLSTDVKATIAIPSQRRSSRNRGNSPFDDPFFDSFFQQYENKEITLKSKPSKTKVLSPPTEGRPTSFSGAVGQYTLKGGTIPNTLTTGEAVTLEVAVEGKGNFDRVNSPVLSPADYWKTYQEKTKFERGDIVDFHARKTFSIPAIVTKPGEINAHFQFSYFDPETGEYHILKTPAQKITVTGEAVSLADIKSGDTEPTANTPGQSLPVLKESISNINPTHALHHRPIFWITNGLLLIVIIATGILGLRHRYCKRNPETILRHKTNKKLKKILTDINDNVSAGNSNALLQNCRLALQTKLASYTGAKPQAITIYDLLAHSPHCVTAIEIFKEADEYEFASASTQPENFDSLGDWAKKTKAALEEIKQDRPSTQTTEQTHWGQIASTS